MGKSSFDSKQAREADGTYLEYNVIQESTDEAFFHRNPNFLGLGKQFGQINFVTCPCFPLINHYFLQKHKLLIPNPKYLF